MHPCRDNKTATATDAIIRVLFTTYSFQKLLLSFFCHFHEVNAAALKMFGLLLSGRLVDTSFRQVDPTHAVIDIIDVNAFNHVVVFLTGQQPFPDGMGGAVYFSWPDPNAPPTWQFLGSITNVKPSAIFKVRQEKCLYKRIIMINLLSFCRWPS